MRNFTTIFTFMLVLMASSCHNKSEPKGIKEYQKIPNSILIIYTSGTPSKTLSDIKPEEMDAFSGATPADMNVEIISQTLVAKLRSKKYTVRIARASEIESYKEILQYDLLIVGSPTYFWNMHWEIKKMMDVNFEKIYIAEQKRFKNQNHIVFAMSEYGRCAEEANKRMESAITDCSAKVDSSMVFITKETMPQYEKQISGLVEISDRVMRRN